MIDIKAHITDGVAIAIENATKTIIGVSHRGISLSRVVEVGLQPETDASLFISSIDLRRQNVHLLGGADDVWVGFGAVAFAEIEVRLKNSEHFEGPASKVASALN